MAFVGFRLRVELGRLGRRRRRSRRAHPVATHRPTGSDHLEPRHAGPQRSHGSPHTPELATTSRRQPPHYQKCLLGFADVAARRRPDCYGIAGGVTKGSGVIQQLRCASGCGEQPPGTGRCSTGQAALRGCPNGSSTGHRTAYKLPAPPKVMPPPPAGSKLTIAGRLFQMVAAGAAAAHRGRATDSSPPGPVDRR